jgi:hypothetical protein
MAFYAGRNGGSRYRHYPTHQTSQGRSEPTHNPSKPSYLGPHSPDIEQNSSSKDRHVCQICSRIGHIAKLCYKRYTKDPEWKPNPRFKAYVAQAPINNQDSSNWIIDSGANHYVTSDLNNLSSFFAYNSPDKLQIGNDLGLPISHIGSSSLTTFNFSIKLTNVLYVSNFSTNLVRLSKLLLDNPHLSINFDSFSCTIKDIHIKISPLQILVSMDFILSR